MLATFLGFCAFALMCVHVFGAYAKVSRGVTLGKDGQPATYDVGCCVMAVSNAMMSTFWLLVTSRLLGW